MPNLNRSIAFLSALMLSGCSVSTPFQGPGYDPANGVTIEGEETFIVAVTRATRGWNITRHPAFWSNVEKVEDVIVKQPGFVGHMKRTEVLGRETWTLSVWTDHASIDAFVRTNAHQQAISDSYADLDGARFVRFEIDRSAIPPSWQEALKVLDEKGSGY